MFAFVTKIHHFRFIYLLLIRFISYPHYDKDIYRFGNQVLFEDLFSIQYRLL